MKNKYVLFTCFLALLLVPAVASAQSAATTTDNTEKASTGHIVKPRNFASWLDKYFSDANHGRTRRPQALYEVARSTASPETEGAKAETPDTGSTSEAKPDDAPAPPKPAIEEEIDALKARIADLEKNLEEGGGSAGGGGAASRRQDGKENMR